jgi:hypothetical protein
MTIKNLQTLATLVNQKEINLIGFYYPIVSPSLKLKWTAIYQDKDINEFSISEFDTFLIACNGLLAEALKSAIFTEIASNLTEVEILDANSYIDKIVEFINDEISTETIKPIWLFGLEYNNELRDNAIWIGTIEGDVYLDMQITKEGASLSDVCKQIYKEITNLASF